MNVLVIGKAKTGTTLISKVIANSLTGPVQYFMEPKGMAFFQTPRNSNSDENQPHHVVKIIFEHWDRRNKLLSQVVNNESPFQFDKRVFIVRDLRDEIISRILYYAYAISHDKPDKTRIDEWIRILEEKESEPGKFSCLAIARKLGMIFGLNGEEIIHGSISQSEVYSRFMSEVKCPYLLVRYEDFMRGDMLMLGDYLGLSALKPLRPENNAPDEDGTLNIVRRSASFDNWKSFFTEEDILYLKPRLNETMEKMGYTDWELTPAEKLETAHYSGYIRRIFNLSSHQGTPAEFAA